jgi:predicted enzyme related to lactoylglutathione lyase
MAHGQITHIEFPADDTGRAQAFYKGLFGWQFQTLPGFDNYYMFSTGEIDSAGGAIGLRGDSTGDKLRIYVTVDSIDDALAKVPGLGGKVTTPKTEIPGQGWYAVVEDSEGSEIGLYENLPAA